jgi:PatG C-terminal
MPIPEANEIAKPPEIVTDTTPALPSVAPPPPESAKSGTCPTCSIPSVATGRPSNFIYAIGRIEPRFPRISVEKELAQAAGQTETASLTDRQALRKVLLEPRNRYVARQLCWVMTILGLEKYIVLPRQPSDLDLLVEALRPEPEAGALDVAIGVLGPIAPPDLCNGLSLPIVIFDQFYSFAREALIKTIPRPDKAGKEFDASAAEVLDRILAATDNAGVNDEHRAVNYLAVRYPGIYARAAECHHRDMSLTSMEMHPWGLSVSRRVVEVVFTFTHRKNEFVEKYCVRVDVNDEFPFLVSKMAAYFDH